METKPWTVMVYMVAGDDADFYDAAKSSVRAMRAAPHSEKVNVVVYLEAEGLADPRVFSIRNGIEEPVDIASPQSLGDFVRISATRFTARRYLLVLWGHGNGIDWKREMCSRVCSFAALFPDSTEELSLRELGKEFKGTNIKREDLVLGFDSCLMGMVEVYYELRRCAQWVVGGADCISYKSWPYKKILERLVSDSETMEPQALTAVIVDECVKRYSKDRSRVSFSAGNLDTNICRDLAEKVKGLAQALGDHLGEDSVREALTKARLHAADYDEKAYIDLHAFCSKLQTQLPDDIRTKAANDVRSPAAVVVDILAKQFVTSYAFSKFYGVGVKDSRAVSICLPESPDSQATDVTGRYVIAWKDYNVLRFSEDTQWPIFLKKFWSLH